MTTFKLGDCACITTTPPDLKPRRCLAHTVEDAACALFAALHDIDMAILTYRRANQQVSEEQMRELRIELSVALISARNAQHRMATIPII